MVPGEGLEPSRNCFQRILSPSCLPFHHLGKIKSLGFSKKKNKLKIVKFISVYALTLAKK